MIYDITVIGGGPAGYTAALYGARAGYKTLVIEKMSVGGQLALTDIIENYPGFEVGINGFDLSLKMQKQAEAFGAETKYAEVLSAQLEGENKKIITTGGEIITKTVIIATGATPKKLGVKGEAELIGRGVSYCATCDGMFYRGKTVAVVGGGNTALGDVIYLSRIAKEVILIHRRDTFRATKIYRNKLNELGNVKRMLNCSLSEILYENTITGAKVKNNVTGETAEILLDGLFVAIGHNPVTNIFADKIELDGGGYIIADETTETNIKGVFAIGDVRTKPLRQVVTAVADGAVAVSKAEEYIEKL